MFRKQQASDCPAGRSPLASSDGSSDGGFTASASCGANGCGATGGLTTHGRGVVHGCSKGWTGRKRRGGTGCLQYGTPRKARVPGADNGASGGCGSASPWRRPSRGPSEVWMTGPSSAAALAVSIRWLLVAAKRRCCIMRIRTPRRRRRARPARAVRHVSSRAYSYRIIRGCARPGSRLTRVRRGKENIEHHSYYE